MRTKKSLGSQDSKPFTRRTPTAVSSTLNPSKTASAVGIHFLLVQHISAHALSGDLVVFTRDMTKYVRYV